MVNHGLFSAKGVESIEVDVDDRGLWHACGGTNLRATLSQGNLQCTTSGSRPFSRGDTVRMYGGECKHRKFNHRENIDINVYDTTGDSWCSKQGSSLTINMEEDIRIVAYMDSSSQDVSHNLRTSKKLAEQLEVTGEDINHRDRYYDRTALHIAALKDYLEEEAVAKYLLLIPGNWAS